VGKKFCPNLILLSQITYRQQVLMLRLKRTIQNRRQKVFNGGLSISVGGLWVCAGGA